MTRLMIPFPRLLTALVIAGLVILAPSMVHGNPAALTEIDHIVHEWEDGDLTAEEAMEEIEILIHDLPADQRVGVIAEIDHLVHEWEDGDLTAEEALELIEELVHAAPAAAGADGTTAPAPAAAGSAGLLATSGGSLMAAGLGLMALVFLAGARAATKRADLRR